LPLKVQARHVQGPAALLVLPRLLLLKGPCLPLVLLLLPPWPLPAASG
jgi:hypothetical protein